MKTVVFDEKAVENLTRPVDNLLARQDKIKKTVYKFVHKSV